MAESAQLFRDVNVVVVGGSAGLGRQYCIDLARVGARVVVAGRSNAVNQVVEQICGAGGAAIACIADAREGERIVEAALTAYGRIDAMIVNAGITRDRSFAKMSKEDWSEVLSIHVDGAFSCARAVWGPMSQQQSGRILFTTSGAGMHGNFGQCNYAAAKGAIIGLMRSLAFEGAPRNIKVNAIAPMALTAMTERIFDDKLRAALKPELVSPVALALIHPHSTETGAIIETGGGWISKMRWERSKGVRLPDISVETVLAHWGEISRFDEAADYPQTIMDCLYAALGVPLSTENDPAVDRRSVGTR